MLYKKYGYKKKATKSKAVVRKRSVRPNRAFKKKVLSIIHKEAETKEAFTTQAAIQYKNAISTANASFSRLIPNVSQGAGDNARIGDQIRVQSIKWRGILNMVPQGTSQADSTRRIGIRVMVLTPKAFGNWGSASANYATWQNYILKKGGTATGFTGVIDDLFAPVNTDAVTCHFNKVYKFTQGSFFQATVTAANGIVPYENASMVKFMQHTFRFKNRLFKYDANIDSGVTPTNTAMVIAVGFVYLDGTAPDTASRVSFQYDSIMKYEDA